MVGWGVGILCWVGIVGGSLWGAVI